MPPGEDARAITRGDRVWVREREVTDLGAGTVVGLSLPAYVVRLDSNGGVFNFYREELRLAEPDPRSDGGVDAE